MWTGQAKKYRAQYEHGCGHSGKPWRMNDFLFCRIVNKEGVMNDFWEEPNQEYLGHYCGAVSRGRPWGIRDVNG